MFGCKHEWEDESFTFNPPSDGIAKGKARGSQSVLALQRLWYGYTNIKQRCTKCKKVNVLTVTGEAK